MKCERRFSFAGMTVLVSLVIFVPGLAQRSPVIAIGDDHQDTPSLSSSSLGARASRPPRLSTDNSPSESASIVQPQPLHLPRAAKLSLLDKAYLDVFSILKDDNSCSRFYGGPAAIEVLNRLTQQLAPSHLENGIGLRMTGITTLAQNNSTGLSYRLFQKAELNLNGPFYKSIASGAEAVPGIGMFAPNTRAARVTILLHELGHLIRKPNRDWLLQNDGDSDARSRENTNQVIAVCTNQITHLELMSFEAELLSANRDSLHPTVANLASDR